MIQKIIICMGLILFVLQTGGCDRDRKPDAAVDRSPDAATVGTEPISAEELPGYIERRLSSAAGSLDESMVRRYLHELVTTRSLAQEARWQQLNQRPEIRRGEMSRKKKEFIASVADETKVKIDRKGIERIAAELQKTRKVERTTLTVQTESTISPPMLSRKAIKNNGNRKVTS